MGATDPADPAAPQGPASRLAALGRELISAAAGGQSLSGRQDEAGGPDYATGATGPDSSGPLVGAEPNTTSEPWRLSVAQPLQQLHQQPQPEQSFGDWWNDYWSRQPFPSGYTQSSITLLACLITTIIFLIVVGNLLVCIAIFTEKSLKPSQNWFIASLAVSDMLLGLIVMPFSLARELMGFWIFGPLWCDIHEAVDVLLTTASINTLCLISYDRYRSITQAVSYLRKRTPCYCARMIASVWLISALVSLPPLIGWKKPPPVPLQAEPPPQPPQTTTTATLRNQSSLDPAGPESEPDELGQNQAEEDDEARQVRRRRQPLRRDENESSPHASSHQMDYGPDPLGPQLFRLADDTNEPGGRHPGPGLTSYQRPFLHQVRLVELGPLEPARPLQVVAASSGATPSQAAAPPAAEYPTCQLSDDLGYVLYSALGSFFIPCAIMVFTYIKIFLAARSRARRAISKQTRAAQQADKAKRMAAARRTGPAGQLDESAPRPKQLGAAELASGPAGHQLMAKDRREEDDKQEPMASKLVVVGRRKSTMMSPPCTSPSPALQSSSPMVGEAPRPTATSDHDQAKAASEPGQASGGSCTLIRSEAKPASPSALAGPATGVGAAEAEQGPSSMITVMSGSLAELPVTRFSFRGDRRAAGRAGQTDAGPASDSGAGVSMIEEATDEEEHLEVDAELDAKAAALLKAFSQIREQPVELADDMSLSSPAPVSAASNQQAAGEPAVAAPPSVAAAREDLDMAGASSTNETCFMTIEEDSDNFEAQTGRTIMMVAGNARRSNSLANKSQGIVMKMLPPTQAGPELAAESELVCNNVACLRRGHTKQQGRRGRTIRANSSVCGSMSNDEDDEGADHHHDEPEVSEDECDEEEDDEEDDDDDDDDDEDDDDLLTTDECNGYSGSCGMDAYCGATTSSTCAHCRECNLQNQAPDEPGAGDAKPGELSSWQLQQQQQQQRPHLHHRAHHHQHLERDNQFGPAHQGPGCASETEAQSLTADDNLSLTEYRSNELDNSSLVGHDLLDATIDKSPRSSANDKRRSLAEPAGATIPSTKSPSGPSSGAAAIQARKKSSIGSRLARLGGSVPSPLSSQSGGLLALAASQQQQAISKREAAAGAAPYGAGAGVETNGLSTTRNLKALRQNFFNKLNQLTAKSALKQHSYKSHSSTGKSSAQSSGSSYEPSVDCATTSNIHSTMDAYHQETTFGDTEDYEQQISGDTSNVRDSARRYQSDAADERRAQFKHHDQPSMEATNFEDSGHEPGSSYFEQYNKSRQRPIHEQHMRATQEPETLQRDSNGKPCSGAHQADVAPTSGHIPARPRSQSKLGPVDGARLLRNNSDMQADSANQVMASSGLGRNMGPGGAAGGPTLMNRGPIASTNNSPGAMVRGKRKLSSKLDARTGNMIAANSAARQTGAGGAAGGRAYLASDNERHKRKLAKARERRATLILGLIMTTFVCSWLPFFTFYVLRAVYPATRDFVSPRFEAFIFWMGYCNSAINPIIYTIFNRDFRKAFRKILFKCL